MNNYEAEVLLRFLFCKLKFDLDPLIGLKNSIKFKDSMPFVSFLALNLPEPILIFCDRLYSTLPWRYLLSFWQFLALSRPIKIQQRPRDADDGADHGGDEDAVQAFRDPLWPNAHLRRSEQNQVGRLLVFLIFNFHFSGWSCCFPQVCIGPRSPWRWQQHLCRFRH